MPRDITQREKQYHSRAMQQEELKKEELYEIRDLLERVNDSYGHDKLFGTHPRRFMDFTTRTANSAYRKMCPKLHPDNHNQNGYTTTDEKDIATECFVKLQEAKKEFNRQNENVDAVRAYLIKENQKRREEKQLELEMDEEKEKSFFCEKKKVKFALKFLTFLVRFFVVLRPQRAPLFENAS